jgi:hypothetical protein
MTQAIARRDVAVVRVLRARSVEGRALEPGEVVEVSRVVAERLVRSGDAEPAVMPEAPGRLLDCCFRIPIGSKFGVRAIAEWRCWLLIPEEPAKFTLTRRLNVDGESFPIGIKFNITPEKYEKFANGDRLIVTSKIARVLPNPDYIPRSVSIT